MMVYNDTGLWLKIYEAFIIVFKILHCNLIKGPHKLLYDNVNWPSLNMALIESVQLGKIFFHGKIESLWDNNCNLITNKLIILFLTIISSTYFHSYLVQVGVAQSAPEYPFLRIGSVWWNCDSLTEENDCALPLC